jgi:hypothetical protein
MAVILLEDDGAKKIPTQHQIWKYDSMKTLHPDSSGGGDRGVKKISVLQNCIIFAADLDPNTIKQKRVRIFFRYELKVII